jgi:hypothetical protein
VPYVVVEEFRWNTDRQYLQVHAFELVPDTHSLDVLLIRASTACASSPPVPIINGHQLSVDVSIIANHLHPYM